MRGMRHLSVIFVAFFCASFCLADSAKKDQAKADLIAALEKSSMQREGSPPFQLTANFTLTFDRPVNGTYKLYWMSPSVWREEIDMPGYQERIVQNGDKKWVSRNIGYPPLRVQELKRLFSAAFDGDNIADDDLEIDGVKEDHSKGSLCMTVGSSKAKHSSKSIYCIDARLGVVTSWLTEDKQDGDRFSDYTDFGARAYPRSLQYISEGKTVVDANLIDFSPSVPRDGLFLGLPLVDPQPSCASPTHPVAVSTPDPTYSDIARQKKVGGTANLWVSLSSEGDVTDAKVVETVEPSLDRNAIEAVKRWKFKPAMCGNTPVPTELRVQVKFRISQ